MERLLHREPPRATQKWLAVQSFPFQTGQYLNDSKGGKNDGKKLGDENYG